MSIDASAKVASVVQANNRYGYVVGGTADNYYISIPDNDENRYLLNAILLEHAEKKMVSESGGV